MSLTALILVVTGALLHAVWNLLAKQAAGGLPFVWLFGLVSLLVALPFGVSSWQAQPQVLSVEAWAAVVGSGLVHVAYSLALQRGYREADFSVVYPLARGTGPLFAVIGAIVVLGERPSLIGALGIAALLVGIVLISGSTTLLRAPAARLHAGLTWGSLTGLSIAVYTVIDGWAMRSLGVAPVLYYTLGLLLRTIILAPQALRSTQALRQQWQQHQLQIIGVGVLSPLAYTLILFAMTLAPLSYVAPLRELSMLLGMVFAARVFHESLQPSRMVGTACMIAGVILLAEAH